MRTLAILSIAARRALPAAGVAVGGPLAVSVRALSTSRGVRVAAGLELAEGEGSFFARSSSFSDFGLSAEVVEAALRAGFTRPSRVQQLSIPDILSDNGHHESPRPSHVVLTGETGSGKTLAYLLPIIDQLRRETTSGARALVLVPSPALCDQVLVAVMKLVDANGKPLIRAEIGGLAEAPEALPGNPASNAPAVIISTPTGVIDHLQVHYKSASTRRWFVRHVRHLVLDEADTLLTAGYDKQLRQLLSLMLYGRYDHPMLTKIFSTGGQQRHLYEMIKMLSKGSYEADPQLLFSAATLPAGNSPRAVGTMLANALPFALWPRSEGTHRAVERVAFDWQELTRKKPVGKAEQVFAPPLPAAKSKGGSEPSAEDAPAAPVGAGPSDEALATLISPDLAPAVASALRAASEAPCALVFCNKMLHADALAAGLRLEGIRASVYHRAVSRAEREEALRALSQERPAGSKRAEGESMVLVCTDAAARGLDLPAIEHVVHAEFAQNAVNFLHRSGRTGRAGRAGRVTCFFNKDDRELVERLREAMDKGAPLEPVFSRNRSFRKRIKRDAETEARFRPI